MRTVDKKDVRVFMYSGEMGRCDYGKCPMEGHFYIGPDQVFPGVLFSCYHHAREMIAGRSRIGCDSEDSLRKLEIGLGRRPRQQRGVSERVYAPQADHPSTGQDDDKGNAWK